MNTEITDNNVESAFAWVGYDADCAFCCSWVRRLSGPLRRRGFRFVPLQTPWLRERLQLSPNARLSEMRLLLGNGQSLGGAEAVVAISRQLWWGWPLSALARLPGVIPVLRLVYRLLAANRHCLNGACRARRNPGPHAYSLLQQSRLRSASVAPLHLPEPSSSGVTFSEFPSPTTPKRKPPFRNFCWADGLPLVVLCLAALLVRNTLPAWVLMWSLAFALFLGCKWLTWKRAVRQVPATPPCRSFGYLFAWPGMDAIGFLRDVPETLPQPRDWGAATVISLTGACLVLTASRGVLFLTPSLSAWLVMIGVVLMLHFGLFQLAALAWQRAGVKATPLMRSPLRSASLAEFWNRRWNTAFNTLANQLAFRPLARRLNARRAILAVFLISGLIHELVISVPARGGYGLPTLYFLIQGIGVLFERRRRNRALTENLKPNVSFRRFLPGRRVKRWLFMAAFTALPVPLLFHPPFIHHVILPMVHFLGTRFRSL